MIYPAIIIIITLLLVKFWSPRFFNFWTPHFSVWSPHFGWSPRLNYTMDCSHRHGNDFSVGGAKIGEKQSRQPNLNFYFMQYVIFEKDIPSVQWGLEQSPRRWGIFENFCVRSNFTVYKVTFNCNCKLQKKIGGAGCTSCSPIILLGEQLNCSPGSHAMPMPIVDEVAYSLLFSRLKPVSYSLVNESC